MTNTKKIKQDNPDLFGGMSVRAVHPCIKALGYKWCHLALSSHCHQFAVLFARFASQIHLKQ